MWRPAVWRFGARAALLAGAAVAAAACWTVAAQPTPAPQPLENHSDPVGPDLSGAYWCSIDDSGYSYPRFPCEIHRRGSGLELAKLGGSQRFVGRITPDDRGFAFTGKFYCPHGACDQALHGTFVRAQGGRFSGTFTDNSIHVMLVPTQHGAFSRAGFGGDSYGGLSYRGGGGFGGVGYGGNRYGGGPIFPGP